MTSVAFQGVAGAYSEQAVRQYFGPDVESLPRKSFERIFAAVESQDADYGMLPVENSTDTRVCPLTRCPSTTPSKPILLTP